MGISAVSITERLFSGQLQTFALRLAYRVDDIVFGDHESARAKRGSIAAFIIRVASAAIAFFSQVFLARMMGTYEYGIMVLVWVAMIIAGNLSCIGMPTAVIRFLPQYKERQSLAPMRGLLLSSKLIVLASSTTVALLTILGVHLFQESIGQHYAIPLLIAAIALPMIAMGDTLDGTARAHGWTIRALMPTYIVRPIAIFLFLIIAWSLGYPMTATVGLVCSVIATYLTSTFQLFSVSSNVAKVLPQGPRETRLSQWFVVALPLFLVDGFFFLLVNADVLMVGLMMAPEDVGIYYATVKTLALVHFVFFAVKAGVGYLFASHIDDEDPWELRQLARRSATWTFWPSLAIGASMLLVGPMFLSMFGPDFVEGYPLMLVLVIGIVIRASIGPAENLLNMSGNQNICAVILGCVLVINISLNILLIPHFGLHGAAYATALATLAETIALFLVVRSRIGVSMFAFSYTSISKVS